MVKATGISAPSFTNITLHLAIAIASKRPDKQACTSRSPHHVSEPPVTMTHPDSSHLDCYEAIILLGGAITIVDINFEGASGAGSVASFPYDDVYDGVVNCGGESSLPAVGVLPCSGDVAGGGASSNRVRMPGRGSPAHHELRQDPRRDPFDLVAAFVAAKRIAL